MGEWKGETGRSQDRPVRVRGIIPYVKIVASPRAESYIREHGGKVWIWLDPHRALVGSYVWLEVHCEAPRSSRRTKFTRASRRPHRFETTEAGGMEVHYDFGRMELPDELHLDRKGWRRGTHRLEAYWNGSVFVDDPPLPSGSGESSDGHARPEDV